MIPKKLEIENRFLWLFYQRCFRNTENLEIMFESLWNLLFVCIERNVDISTMFIKTWFCFHAQNKKKQTTGKQ